MIELTEKEMKSMDHEFRMRASNLCRSKYQEVMNSLGKFIGYVERTPVLAEYVTNCNAGLSDTDLEEMISAVTKGGGDVTFDFGNSTQEEIARSYRVMKSVLSKDNPHLLFAIGRAYDGDTHFQSSTEGFIHGVAKPFIDGITLYLHAIAANAKPGDSRTITINNNGNYAQINISEGNSALNAQQHNEVDGISDLESLGNYLQKINVPREDIEELKSILTTDKPRSRESLEKSTKQWTAKVLHLVVDGIVSLPIETASSVLATVICKATGLG